MVGPRRLPTHAYAAIVDRLTFGGNIIETGTDSFRLAQTRARSGDITTDGSIP